MLLRVSAIGILLITSVFFYASFSGAQSLPSAQFDLHVKQAEQAISVQKYNEALLPLNNALQINPNSVYAHLLLGSVYEDLGKLQDAVESFQQADRLLPQQPLIYESLGRVYLKLNNVDSALEFANKAQVLDSKKASIHILLGNCYSKKKLIPAAIDAYKKAESLEPKSIASCLLGDALASARIFNEAIGHLEQCVSYRPNLSYAYFTLGICYSQVGRFTDSVDAYKKAVHYDPSKWYYYSNLGLAYLLVKDHNSALAAFLKALELNPQNAETHYQIGQCYSLQKNREQALKHFEQAIALDNSKARYWFSLGLIFAESGETKKAISSFTKAVDLEPNDANGHYWLALQLEADNDMQNALEEFNKSVSINPNHPYANYKLALNSLIKGNFEEAFQRVQIPEREYSKLGNKSKIAECHFFMGSVLFQMGKDIHAIQKLESALDLYEKESDLSGQALALNEMGNIYNQLGDYSKALMYLQRAYGLYETNSDYDGMVRVLGTQALTSYARAMHTDEVYTETISIAKKALKIGREQQLNFIDSLLPSISALGAAYWQNDDKSQVIELINETEPFKNKFQMPLSRFAFDVMIGKGYEQLDQLDLAELHLGRAVKALSEGNVKTLSAFIHAAYARLKEKTGELEEAHRLYDLAIKEHERFRGNTQTLSFKMAAGERMLTTYNEAIGFLINKKDYAGAFNLAERSKARSFLDLMGTKLASSESADNKLIEEERRLQFAMSKLEEQLAQASSAQSGQESPKVNTIKIELDNNRVLYNQLIERIKKERPELSSLLTVNPSNFREIQSLLDDDTTILEYYITEKRTFLWVVSKQNLSLVEIAIKQKDLKQKVNSFRDSISSLSNDYKHQAIDLYDLLIRPALSHIKNKRLAIVPHSVLHYLPFQALIDSNNTNSQDDLFLIQQYDVYYLPSASLMKFTTSKRKQNKDSILAFGNPDTAGNNIDLIYAAKEVESIKKIYPDALVFVGAEASKKNMKQFANQFSIVHFASHAELNSQSPMLSSLKLSSEKDGEGDLQLHEVFHLNLSQTSLVVLSACETGLGKLTTGDEVNGLSRGFIYAGSPSVIASLWKVSDESTATLMSYFYSNLQSSDKAKSLRIAQIELISGKAGKKIVRDANEVLSRGSKARKSKSFAVNGSHPFFWAPFVLIGDWQ